MGIKGSLREASLADVCQLLTLGQKSGCLSIADGARFGQIFFDRGRITYARIVNRRDRLGDLLVGDGVLTQEQLDDVLRRQAREPDRRVGELLVATGYITRGELTKYVQMQIEEAIYHLFTWSRGNFFFEGDARAEDADIILSINPESLLLEAARRVDEWSLIEKKIPSFDLIFQVETDRLTQSRAQLTAEQQHVVRLADGTRTVQEIVERTGLTEFSTGKALFGLVQAGLARSVGRREDTTRGRETELQERRNLGIAFYRTSMLEDAAREFERVLELDPGDLAARSHLAFVRLREGQHREAIRRFRQLLEEGGPHFGTFVNLALALRLAGRVEDALLVLEEAEKLRPGVPLTALSRAIALLHAHRFDDAEEAFEQYHSLLRRGMRPGADYFYFRAVNHAIRRQLNEADALVATGLDEYPESPPLLLLSGLISERRGDLDDADRCYRQVLVEDASMAQAHKSLGDICYRRGAHEEALTRYLRATEVDADLGDDVHARIGNLLYKSHRVDAAMESWQRALQLNPGNTIVRNNLQIATDALSR
jgi:tetratricopeptide (TPR) repeat protein